VITPGSVCDDIVLNVDFAQTFLELAGVDAHPRMQGRSLVPVLHGETPGDWQTSMYYRYWEHLSEPHRVQAHYGVRTKTHKLIYYYAQALGQPPTKDERREPEWELFDLVRDPHELRSVYADPEYAGVRDELTAELARLQVAVVDSPA
jgi:arylsulfatase A-like enzyme